MSATGYQKREVEVRQGGKVIGRIIFELKHGIWFWVSHTSHEELRDLPHWGDTVLAVERMCRRKHLDFVWP